MINHRKNEIVIVTGLENYLSTENRPCKVVRQNQVAEVPHYPYVSYTVTTPVSEYGGTYSADKNGTLYRGALQTWSFTVQSDNQDEAMELGMKLYDFFSVVALTMLSDNDITVRRVTNLTTRDNLITIQYEYRKGLDVTFGLLNIITTEQQMSPDVIETTNLTNI